MDLLFVAKDSELPLTYYLIRSGLLDVKNRLSKHWLSIMYPCTKDSQWAKPEPREPKLEQTCYYFFRKMLEGATACSREEGGRDVGHWRIETRQSFCLNSWCWRTSDKMRGLVAARRLAAENSPPSNFRLWFEGAAAGMSSSESLSRICTCNWRNLTYSIASSNMVAVSILLPPGISFSKTRILSLIFFLRCRAATLCGSTDVAAGLPLMKNRLPSSWASTRGRVYGVANLVEVLGSGFDSTQSSLRFVFEVSE